MGVPSLWHPGQRSARTRAYYCGTCGAKICAHELAVLGAEVPVILALLDKGCIGDATINKVFLVLWDPIPSLDQANWCATSTCNYRI